MVVTASVHGDVQPPQGRRQLTAGERLLAAHLARTALANQPSDRQMLADLLIHRRSWWRPRRHGGDLLGSGLGLSVPSLVEATVVAAQALAALVAAGVAEAVGERALPATTSWFTRRRRQSNGDPNAAITATQWSPTQLAEIHRSAKLAAGRTGVTASEAEQIAYKIVAGLVLPSDDDAGADEQPDAD